MQTLKTSHTCRGVKLWCIHRLSAWAYGGIFTSMLPKLSLFLLFSACPPQSGLKAVFCILLTTSHPAGVQRQRRTPDWGIRQCTGKEEGGENFLPLLMEDLSAPAEPSVPARFSHRYQKEREKGVSGLWLQGRGGTGGDSRWLE